MGDQQTGNTSGNGQPQFPAFANVIPGGNIQSMFLPPNGALYVFVMGPGNANVNVYADGYVGQVEAEPGRTFSGTSPPTMASPQQQPPSRATYNAMRIPRLDVQRTSTRLAAESSIIGSGQENCRVTRSQTKAASKPQGRRKT